MEFSVCIPTCISVHWSDVRFYTEGIDVVVVSAVSVCIQTCISVHWSDVRFYTEGIDVVVVSAVSVCIPTCISVHWSDVRFYTEGIDVVVVSAVSLVGELVRKKVPPLQLHDFWRGLREWVLLQMLTWGIKFCQNSRINLYDKPIEWTCIINLMNKETEEQDVIQNRKWRS